MKTLFAFICLMSISAVTFADTYERSALEIRNDAVKEQQVIEDWVDYICPYGDAIITGPTKDKVAEVDCVNYDTSTGTWITWGIRNTGSNAIIYDIQHWDKSKFRIWTMDGELIIKRDKIKLLKTYTE